MARDEKHITKIVAACLLGDASISAKRGPKGNCRFSLTLTEGHEDHLQYIAEALEPITRISYYRNAGKDDTKPYVQMYTMSHPFYNTFRERMYGTGVKAIDRHYLLLMDWESLAIWHMHDGYYNISRNQVSLATQSFTYGDNHYLRIMLKEKFDLNFSVVSYRLQSGNLVHRLDLSKKDSYKFIDGIAPFVQPSFSYKIERRMNCPAE